MKSVQAFFLVVILALMFTCAQGQEIGATYTYDANGNRAGTLVVHLDNKELAAPVVDSITVENRALPVAVYPNPTAGVLKVLIPDSPELGDARGIKLAVHNMQGCIVIQKEEAGNEAYLSLYEQPEGVYLLTIEAYGKTSSFKIVKQD